MSRIFVIWKLLRLNTRFQRIRATVDIFETLDIVLAQVAARLHLGDFHRDLARGLRRCTNKSGGF